MSTSLKVVRIAALFCASLSRVAIVLRNRVIRTRSSRRSPVGAGGGGGGGAAVAGAGGGAAADGGGGGGEASWALAAARTSSLVSRPSLPVPLIFDGSR